MKTAIQMQIRKNIFAEKRLTLFEPIQLNFIEVFSCNQKQFM